MFLSFLHATFRNLLKNKVYSFLNIFGLAIGIACAGLIFLWIEDEVNYDKAHLKRDNLYAVLCNWKYAGNLVTTWSTPGPLGPAIKAEIPGIKNSCRTSEDQTALIDTGEKSVYATGRFAETSLFEMFTLPFVQGNPQHAFKQLHSVVITEKAARKLFGVEKNCIGKTIRLDKQQEYVVTGILKDLPPNSTLQFEWLAPFEPYFQQASWLQSWGNLSVNTYVELQDATESDSVNKRLYSYIQHKQGQGADVQSSFLFNLNNWHLYSAFQNGKPAGGRIETVRLLTIIAWIILLIACINFMNLATARSGKRSREVGVRKVLGAGKGSLVLQFIGEALIMAILSAMLGLLIIWFALPWYNNLVDKNLLLELSSPAHLVALVILILVCGLVAGSYPSLYLSSFNPVFVLKGIQVKAGSASLIRKGLVVLQFTASIVFIIGTIIILQQLQHVKSRNLGFTKDHLIEVKVQGDMAAHFLSMKQALLNTGLIENAALSNHSTLYEGNSTASIRWQGKADRDKIVISTRYVTSEYISTVGLQLLEGRGFLPGVGADSLNAIITESLAKLLGKGSALGKTLITKDWGYPNVRVIGVVKDYVYGNMYGKPDPVIFFGVPSYARILYIRSKVGSNPEKVLSAIEGVHKRINPGYPFEYRFVDDQFNQLFSSERLMSKLAEVFAALAILISCLGLFGLAAYTAERRTKEVGVRKVLGASVAGIARLLSMDFLQLVAISCLLAFPVAWWAMHNWLQNYEYRVAIHWWVFALAGSISMLIAVLTVSFQAVKAAIANPVKSLRTE
jgi:predicted permease